MLASEYFTVLCNAIAQLCMPASAIGQDAKNPARAEEWAFQTILGIILSGLLREGISKETGIWISVAYRLILEHCPPIMDERSLEWQRLFTGLQIVDLEHASIYLSCPAIPIIAPFPRLRISLQDQLYRLSRMMHTGLTHFTGRGLPTIWSCFSGELAVAIDPAVSFSDVDAAVIRDWARQLDDWLVEFGARNDEPETERKLVFRQYVLHRVLVLSIYLPARGSDLFSDTTPKEQHELLVSARAAVKLQLADSSIWSNFDLVIITWAALIVMQGVEGGVGEIDVIAAGPTPPSDKFFLSPHTGRAGVALEDRGTDFACEEEITDAMVDLAGVRVALYFPDDLARVEDFVKTAFKEVKPQIIWGIRNGEVVEKPDSRFIGYRATHFRVCLMADGRTKQPLTGKTVEIQVTSVVMHAWADVHHDLIYKPGLGEVTEEERRILDLINGLAHTSEVALQQLQATLEKRIKQEKRKFNDQYELATWLNNHVSAGSKMLSMAALQ
ncbi:hypothetical protein G7Z17_g2650 [Cylindrodendrum hubeiense]|uniref:RelA/SpoT domain-containing protein n=1 Tax=Cylindrodendrum hubeiense TaxID=595255 RepID=A0A9P5LBF5_9HYPO|nr:hypothetical protein G7Z17_g2650 [Cylindrodendrum hubeiense]